MEDINKLAETIDQLIIKLGIENYRQSVLIVFVLGLAIMLVVQGVFWFIRSSHTSKAAMLEDVNGLQTIIDKLMEEADKLDAKYEKMAKKLDAALLTLKRKAEPQSINEAIFATRSELLEFMSDYTDFLIRFRWYQRAGLKNRYFILKVMDRTNKLVHFYCELKGGMAQIQALNLGSSIPLNSSDMEIIRRFLKQNLYWRMRNRSTIRMTPRLKSIPIPENESNQNWPKATNFGKTN